MARIKGHFADRRFRGLYCLAATSPGYWQVDNFVKSSRSARIHSEELRPQQKFVSSQVRDRRDRVAAAVLSRARNFLTRRLFITRKYAAL